MGPLWRAPNGCHRGAWGLCCKVGGWPRYTTLLRAVELWGAVRADGPGRLAGDEEPPPVDGLVVCRKQDLSQKIKADPEDRLSPAFGGLDDDDGPVFRLPFTGRVGERKGHSQHSEKLADAVGVNDVGWGWGGTIPPYCGSRPSASSRTLITRSARPLPCHPVQRQQRANFAARSPH